jgi:hypothetical protein
MVSGVIYLLTLHFGWQPHSYPDGEAWYFNSLAWQFLFVIGATAGYAPYSRQVPTDAKRVACETWHRHHGCRGHHPYFVDYPRGL